MLDRGLLAYDALGRARARASRPPLAYGVERRAAEPRQRVPRRGPLRGQRDARARGRARPPAREPPARAVLVRPGHGPARGHHARLQHGDRRRSTSARSRTAASTSRACSTARQEVAANIGGSGAAVVRRCVRPRRAAARCCATQYGDRGFEAGRHAAAADARAARRRCARDATRAGARTPAPFTDLRVRGSGARPRDARDDASTASRRGWIDGALDAARAAPARHGGS